MQVTSRVLTRIWAVACAAALGIATLAAPARAQNAEETPDDLVSTLVSAGLVVPEKPREKPVFVEHGAEIFWFNRNAKGELWLNAKASKFADKKSGDAESPADGGEAESDGANAESGEAGEKKARRPRGRKKSE